VTDCTARRRLTLHLFHDKTLIAIAAARPLTLQDLAATPVVCPAKLARYGEEILEPLRRARRES
jgi:superfamily II DNA helicase RecQ